MSKSPRSCSRNGYQSRIMSRQRMAFFKILLLLPAVIALLTVSRVLLVQPVDAFVPTASSKIRLPVTLLVATKPEGFSATPTPAASSTGPNNNSNNTNKSSHYSPLYSLQLVNAKPVSIESPTGKKIWRPIVSRVTRVTVDAARRVIDKLPYTKKAKGNNAVANTPASNTTSSSFETRTTNPGYQATLRSWIRRVVRRKRKDDDETLAMEFVQPSAQKTTGNNDTVNTNDKINDDTLWQSLASQEAGASTRRQQQQPQQEQPLSSRDDEKLAAKYASIECLEEKAYTILKDLGMIEPSLDFFI